MIPKEKLVSFHQGYANDIYNYFGAHVTNNGVHFAVYAPHAKSVRVIGSFNNWGDNQYMIKTDANGIWELEIPEAKEFDMYKYRIESNNGQIQDKADPIAFFSELRPGTASVVCSLENFKWSDSTWIKNHTRGFNKAINIYEVHAGGWKRHDDVPYSYEELKNELIPYVKEKGFNYIEFMPLNEHPFDGSWGYQANGYFSCTSRYGKPDEFMDFVNECHKQGIGVIMDMVPVHFVKDEHGLRYFDGEALYEYPTQKIAESQWGTLNFNLGSEEVRSFLQSSACMWCEKYHIDGIRIDAVANIIFWEGNKDKGENKEAISFTKRLNFTVHERFNNVMMIAEDSSDYPSVTKPTVEGGLGFDYKWDLGWMNDTLKYYELDPIYRKYNHNQLTFSMAYFYFENFILPLSHDEVVHGKKTIVDRMWGTYEQKFAQAKNLYVYMYTHPGKKLNFMGNEFAVFREFDEEKELDWFMLKYPIHDSFARFFKDISNIYDAHPALYQYDYYFDHFKWIDADNKDQSIYSYYRFDDKEGIFVVLNMTPNSYEDFKLGVPYSGSYTEILNTEKDIYTGCNMCNYKPIKAVKEPMNNLPYTLSIRLAPFAAIIFKAKVVKPTVKKATKKAGK